jgi:bifunctional non-homologous end joining protein LigD
MAGVLKSWAVPKGPSLNHADKRLAIMVDDHSLEYFDFEGIISPGQYGAGTVVIWDSGNYRLLEGNDPVTAVEGGKIVFELLGGILKGGFALVKMKRQAENNWLLMKRNDEYSQTEWTLPPALTEKLKTTLLERTPPCKPHRCAELGLPIR